MVWMLPYMAYIHGSVMGLLQPQLLKWSFFWLRIASQFPGQCVQPWPCTGLSKSCPKRRYRRAACCDRNLGPELKNGNIVPMLILRTATDLESLNHVYPSVHVCIYQLHFFIPIVPSLMFLHFLQPIVNCWPPHHSETVINHAPYGHICGLAVWSRYNLFRQFSTATPV